MYQRNIEGKKTENSLSKGVVNSSKSPLQKTHASSILQKASIGVGGLSTLDVMQLQKIVGNKAVSQFLTNETLQKAEGPEEEEEPLQGKEIGAIQREEASPEEEEEPIQGKMNETIQREELTPEEEEPLQGKFEGEVTQFKSVSSGGLPEEVQLKMESSFNANFSDVKVHANSSTATEVGALAYTQGSDIHFAPNRYDPESTAGQRLIGHELAHVVQQREGRVEATTEAAGLPVNDDPRLEQEADDKANDAVG